MDIKVQLPSDIEKLKKQIAALKYQLDKDSNMKDKLIHEEALKDLREELLYRQYLELQSKEFREDVKGYEKLKMPDTDISIKVNFTWGWLHVYSKGGQINWY